MLWNSKQLELAAATVYDDAQGLCITIELLSVNQRFGMPFICLAFHSYCPY